MGFSRHQTSLPFSSPGDLPDPGIEPGSPTLQADTLPAEPPGKPHKWWIGWDSSQPETCFSCPWDCPLSSWCSQQEGVSELSECSGPGVGSSWAPWPSLGHVLPSIYHQPSLPWPTWQLLLKIHEGDFPGGQTPHSQCQGPGFDPWSGNYIPHAATNFKDAVCWNEDLAQTNK